MSREYRSKRIIIYPSYIDSSVSRNQGRRVSSPMSVPSPTIDEIFQAAVKLGLNPVLEKDKSHPRQWWVRGRIVIDKTARKQELLARIAKEIKENRSRKPLK